MENTTDDEGQKEGEWIRRVLAGDSDAFAPLVRRHEARVRALCLSLLNNPTEAEDAAQQAFLKAYRGLAGFRREAGFATWIYRIAYRQCLDLLKSRRRRPVESLDALLEKGDAVFGGWASENAGTPNGEFAVELVNRLPEEYRRVLVLRESQGFSYEEIAFATGASLDSIKARLRRARRTLVEAARHFSKSAGVQKARTTI